MRTAHDRKSGSSHRSDETFIVLMGDALTDVDIRELVFFHEQKGAIVMLALTRVADTSEYGGARRREERLEVTGEARSQRSRKQPGQHRHLRLRAPGARVRPQRHLLRLRRRRLPALLEAGEKVVGSQGDFYWSDVGTLGSCRAAQRDALSGRVAVEVPGERWGKNLWIAKKARIHPSAYGHIEGFATSAKI